MTTITATITTNNDQSRFISFDQAQKCSPPPRSSQLPPNIAATVLTPAQQREAEADAYIQRAIELHENDQLEEATYYFRLAAQSENPVGQLMYGLSLRHGWGCNPNPKEAIIYLQRAAAYAMSELKELIPGSSANIKAIQQQQQKGLTPTSPSSSTSGVPPLRRMGTMDRRSAMLTARKELVMALYELGMSFLKGWGVHRDKSAAFNYFKIAADLGDADSQNETAQCFLDGIGTDKNAFEAARYCRLAAAQGATQFGNSWIWKEKYDQYCEQHANTAATESAMRKQKELNPHQGSTALMSPISPMTPTTPSSIAAGLASMTVGATSMAMANSSLTSPIQQNTQRLSQQNNAKPGSGQKPGRHNLAGDLISSSQLELKIKQAEQLTNATVGPVTSSPSSPSPTTGQSTTSGTGKKKNRWSLWGLHQNHNHRGHRRAPSSG
ncbi:hypothetical protein BGZ65_011526 [Modicella reniformis]|uniref:HCP-like protein n=1 Tax=Modicella reniformis TaxID=1440133 RepID=A0A9P6SP37_9FUNG|nr:hypothetical protein BGZ65_011526 [Modicella reniformis]